MNNLQSIPIRIHINGTRGKSSVTRLIAGALRAGGIKTFAKTTGTKPRMIFEDGSEYPIIRAGKANIIEQTKIFRKARERGVDAIVIECMAVKPEYQYFTENKLIKSTVGVITNVREDHIDEMGPTIEDIAKSLCKTIPKNGVLFTAEKSKNLLHIIENESKKLNTKVVVSDDSVITDDMMNRFSYIEHKENVALALKVAEHFGIDKKVALEGMYKAEPDPGVLRKYRIKFFDKYVEFVNAFAANDPDSNLIIWDKLTKKLSPDYTKIIILTCRADRLDRSEQLGKFIGEKIDADFYILTGAYTDAVERVAIKSGAEASKIINMYDYTADKIFEKVIEVTQKNAFVCGIGNIVGWGESIVTYFKNRALVE